MPRRLILALIALTGALLSALVPFAPEPAEAAKNAPTFTLEDCHGKPVTLDQYSGKPLVLNFWATWCPPCQVEIPALSSYASANPGVSVVGVALDSGPADHMPQLRTELGIEYEIFAGNNDIVQAYGVRGLPTTVVIDADGSVSSVHTGPITERELAELVEKAR